MQKISGLILFISFSFLSFSQEFSNVNFYKKDDKIIITYDLINTLPHEVYDIKIKFTSDAGKTYFPRTFTGDTRKVSRGKNKRIVWNVSKDENELKGNLQVVLEIGKAQYQIENTKKTKEHKSKSKNKSGAAKELNGLFFGANIGLYFANKNTANYYNGSGENNLRYVLDNNPWNQNYMQIRQVLNGYDFTYDSTSLPQNMKYDPAFLVGFAAKYHFSNKSALCFEFSSAKLKTADVFTLTLDSVSYLGDPLVLCNIYGNETRFDLNVSWVQVFGNHKFINPYFEAGFNVNNTEIKKNEIKIRTQTYSIMYPYSQINNKKPGGVGYGLIFGAGYQLNFNDKFAFDIGLNLGLKKINVGENQDFKPNIIIYVRLILKSFGLGVSVEKGDGTTDPNDPSNN